MNAGMTDWRTVYARDSSFNAQVVWKQKAEYRDVKKISKDHVALGLSSYKCG